MKHLLSLFLAAAALSASADDFIVQSITFPEGTTCQEKIQAASRIVPSPEQLRWQNHELTAFLHYGMNTFTGREWGDGKEDKALYAPDKLDADQWVKTLKDAGFKLVILTAKHHDGFCLWPTKTTTHCVSPDQDVVKALRKACDKYDMDMGLYVSPWDQNAATYGSDAYNDFYVAQLTELLTNYGRIDEIWFDGANGEGPNGKKQEYDWNRYRDVIYKLQPQAVTAIMGSDIRWVGNEKGEGRETEWCVTPKNPQNPESGLTETSPDLGSREVICNAKSLYWYPSEVDVSIRPGWFYHDNEQPKTLEQLKSIYLTSVGRGSNLLLNIPPDNHGRLTQQDVNRVKEFGQWVKNNFTDNGVALPGKVNCVDLSEDISKGQQVEKFTVELQLPDDSWTIVAEGTTIGHRRIFTFPEVKAKGMKVTVWESRGDVNIARATARYLK